MSYLDAVCVRQAVQTATSAYSDERPSGVIKPAVCKALDASYKARESLLTPTTLALCNVAGMCKRVKSSSSGACNAIPEH